MQSFLRSLNYYSQFIVEFPIYESVLYELREANFHEIRRMEKMELPTPKKKRVDDRKSRGDSDPDYIDVTGGDLTADNRKVHGDSDPDRSGVTRAIQPLTTEKVMVIAIQIVSVLQGRFRVLLCYRGRPKLNGQKSMVESEDLAYHAEG